MKYPYWVKHNGIDYPPNTEIGEEPVATKVVMDERVNEPVVEDRAQITKTEINRMALSELKKFAKANGIKNSEAKSGADLKKELIANLGL